MDDQQRQRAEALRQLAAQAENDEERERLESEAAEAEGLSLTGDGYLRRDP